MRGYSVSKNLPKEGGGYYLHVWFNAEHGLVAAHNLKVQKKKLQTAVKHLLWRNYQMALSAPHRVSIGKGGW